MQKVLKTWVFLAIIVAITVIVVGLIVKKTDVFPPSQSSRSGSLDRLDQWTTVRSKVCNVEIPLPPNVAPYSFVDDDESSIHNDTGRFWQYHEYSSKYLGIFETTARAIFTAPEEGGSGYIPGAVEIICSPNVKGFTTDNMVNNINALKAGITIKSINEENIWGRKVLLVQISGGMDGGSQGYIFATDKNIYFVRKIVSSKNQIVKDTAEEIFNKLNFVEKDTPREL